MWPRHRAAPRSSAGRRVLFSLLLSIVIAPITLANPVDTEAAATLAAEPTWLRLLKADKRRDTRSAIHTPDFFVTGNPEATAREELVALLEAAASSPDNAAALRCRFPARFLWLSRRLSRPAWADFDHCERLQRWAGLDQLQGITLIMISGYFGNPASTFGHSLMRLDNSTQTRESQLLDLSINFGAQVPPKENALVYVVRGLFGGYMSGFSDSTFFAHDQTYSRVEFRDRWEYRLALSDYQEALLAYHLWEIAARQFTYYFLEENCSYRLGELLELVLDASFMRDVSTWYAPVSLFFDLRELDRVRNGSLIAEVTYVPSVEAVLRHSLAALDSAERQTVYAFIDPETPLAPPTGGTTSQQRVLSTSLDYLNYALAGSDEDDPDFAATRERRRQVLAARLSLPGAAPTRALPPERDPPSSHAAPSAFDIGYAHAARRGGYAEVGLAQFRNRGIGNNALERSSLIIADLTLGIRSGSVFLDRLTAIAARKVNAPVFRLPGESASSWEVAVGAERARSDCFGCLETYGEAFWGWSTAPGANWRLLAGGRGRLSSRDAAVELGPEATLVYAPNWRFTGEIAAGFVHGAGRGETRQRYAGRARFSLSNRDEIVLHAERNLGEQFSLVYSRRW